MTQKIDEQIWAIEQKIIILLDKIQEQHYLKEGQRKIKEDVFNEKPLQKNHSNTSAILKSSIILLNDTSPKTQPQSNSDDFLATIQVLEKNYFENNLTKTNKTIVLNNEKKENFPIPQTRITPINELNKLVNEASNLSIKLMELKSESEFDNYICDAMTVKEVNIKTGGDGYILKDNVRVELPNECVSKTCPKRKGNFLLTKWIFECVLCPVNYLQSETRLKQWQAFITKLQNEQKQGES